MQIFFRWQPPPYPRTFTAYPTPMFGVSPDFFIEMTAKDVKEVVLRCPGHFVLRFGAIGDKPLGGW